MLQLAFRINHPFAFNARLPDSQSFLPCSKLSPPQNLNLLLHGLYPQCLHPATIRTPLVVTVYDRMIRDYFVRGNAAERTDFAVLTIKVNFSLLLLYWEESIIQSKP